MTDKKLVTRERSNSVDMRSVKESSELEKMKEEAAKREAELKAREEELAKRELEKTLKELEKREAELKAREEELAKRAESHEVVKSSVAPSVHTNEHSYDINRALTNIGNLNGLEAEVHQELSRGMKLGDNAVVIPTSRDLLYAQTSATKMIGEPKLLEDRLGVANLIERYDITGNGSFELPVVSPDSFDAAEVSETGAHETTPVTTPIVLVPKRVSIGMDVSEMSALSSNFGLQLVNKMTGRVASRIDKMILAKFDADGTVVALADPTAPSYDDVINARHTLRAEYDDIAHVLSNATAKHLRGKATDIRVAFEDNKLLNEPTIMTSAAADNVVFMIAREAAALGMWGGLVVKRHENARNGVIEYTATAYIDVAVVQPSGIVVLK